MATITHTTRSGSIVWKVQMSGVQETVRAFDRLGDTAQDELVRESRKIAESLVGPLKAAAAGDGAQSALLVPTVQTVKSKVPAVRAGGPKRVGRQGEAAGGLVFSSEFGQNMKSGWYAAARYRGSRGRQWHPNIGAGSYWFHKTVKRREDDIFRRWFAACDRLLARWGAGG